MYLIQSGSKLSIADIQASYQKLPTGNYLLKVDQYGRFFLETKEPFKLPSKLYGDHSITERWKKAFNASTKNLGILLSGLKGSGKTITAQKLCIELGKPVIMVTESYGGPEFLDFLTSPLLGECVIFIDEFEKIFSDTDRSKDLLSLMDGSYPTRLLFLLTVNEDKINPYLNNRLSRIKYYKKYESLDDSIVQEVVDDLLIYPEHREDTISVIDRLPFVSFDLLTNIIKEVNLFNEKASVLVKDLNIIYEAKNYSVSFKNNESVVETNATIRGYTPGDYIDFYLYGLDQYKWFETVYTSHPLLKEKWDMHLEQLNEIEGFSLLNHYDKCETICRERSKLTEMTKNIVSEPSLHIMNRTKIELDPEDGDYDVISNGKTLELIINLRFIDDSEIPVSLVLSEKKEKKYSF